MSRSGYTGEDGFEIGLPEADARDLVAKLLSDDRVMWIGLAARDSLRLEAGLCLHGQDITEEIDPATAGLMWAIAKDLRTGGGFVGAAGAARDRGARTRRKARRAEAGGTPAGARRYAACRRRRQTRPAASRPAASVPRPVIRSPWAMFRWRSAKPGTRLFADVRGTKIPLDIHPLPFTPHRYRKG